MQVVISETKQELGRRAAEDGALEETTDPEADDPSPAPHPAMAALAALDPDALSPREAQEALYRLRSMLDGAVFAPQHTLGSNG